MPTRFIWFLFDWRGRLGRRPYNLAIFILGITVAALDIVPFRNPNLLLGISAIQLLVQAALDAKRLHDVGKSAIWVAITSGACVAGAGWVVFRTPFLADLVTDWAVDQIGPSANSPLVCAVFVGLFGAALMRTSWLSMPKSNQAGDAYAHDPLAKLMAASEKDTSGLDADALIAKALEDKRLQEAAAAMRQAVADGRAAAPAAARKSFGRRAAAR